MAKFRYIGDRRHGDCLGYQFPRMIATEVVAPLHIKKLEGNPHFQRMDKGDTPSSARGRAGSKSASTKQPEPPAPPAPDDKGATGEGEPADHEVSSDGEQISTENGEASGDGDEGTNQVAGAE